MTPCPAFSPADIPGFLASLRRPGLLIRAARFGLSDYRRDRDLRRLIGSSAPNSPEALVPILAETEADLEAARQAGDGSYSVTRHVGLLIALLAELRLLQRKAA